MWRQNTNSEQLLQRQGRLTCLILLHWSPQGSGSDPTPADFLALTRLERWELVWPTVWPAVSEPIITVWLLSVWSVSDARDKRPDRMVDFSLNTNKASFSVNFLSSHLIDKVGPTRKHSGQLKRTLFPPIFYICHYEMSYKYKYAWLTAWCRPCHRSGAAAVYLFVLVSSGKDSWFCLNSAGEESLPAFSSVFITWSAQDEDESQRTLTSWSASMSSIISPPQAEESDSKMFNGMNLI